MHVNTFYPSFTHTESNTHNLVQMTRWQAYHHSFCLSLCYTHLIKCAKSRAGETGSVTGIASPSLSFYLSRNLNQIHSATGRGGRQHGRPKLSLSLTNTNKREGKKTAMELGQFHDETLGKETLPDDANDRKWSRVNFMMKH